MHLVLATVVALTQSTGHNLALLLPKPPVAATYAAGGAGAPPYDEGYARCLRQHAGASLCRRNVQPSG